jgi:tRNA nucleotidyltransferase/poly(A) polymerase/nicotinamide mononucleotide adenylyltransferase/GNAT superfamily N-acetyltransferase
MSKLSNYLVEQILLEDSDNPIQKTVVVYPGRFQPFHSGHYKTYQNLVKVFGKENVFIGTSNKVEKPKSPFNFKEKVKIMTTMFGIPTKQIVEIKNPYKPTEILSKFDEDTTAFVTVVGKKDTNRLGGKYFDKYDYEPNTGYRDKGYVYVSPVASNISGTDVRNNLSMGSDESKKKYFTNKAYPKFNPKIFDLVTDKLSESFVIEKETIENWLIKENTTTTPGQDDDGPAAFFPNMDVFNRISINRAKKIGYDVINMIMTKDLEDYYEHPEYPNGPVKAVSFYPAGVIGQMTPNNQVDIYSSNAYSEWYKHVTRRASLTGYELITTQLEKAMQKRLKKLSGKQAFADKEIEKEFELFVNEVITLPVEIGDTLLMGKFKNKKVVVKTIGKDEHGMPTINGKKVVTFRLGKKGPNIFERIVELAEKNKFKNVGETVNCDQCTHSWEIREDDDNPYLCHSCAWDNGSEEYNPHGLIKWEMETLNEAKNKLKITIPSNVKKIVKAFKKHNKKIYIVGGAVRDAILGKTPHDFDLSTDAKAHEMVDICEKENLKYNDKDIIYGTVIIDGEEVTQFRKDIGTNRKLDGIDYTDIEGDVRRRDLTINALFYDIDRGEIVDLVGGIKDLQDKKIRTVGKAADRFEEDHLRKLRAIRFTVKIGGTMDTETLLAIKQDPTLKDVSSNRIRMEFMKSVESAKSTKIYLDLMEKLKFLPLTFPGLKINKPYIDENDYIILMAQLLKKNSKDKLESVLNKINYTSNEITDVNFLISLDDFTPDKIVDYKKDQKRTKLSDKQILDYGKHNNKDYKKFVKFNTSVSGKDAPKDVKGKDIGNWIQDEEKRRFLNEMAKSELNAVEKFADKILNPTDVEFSTHFFDRLNDPRNGKEITYSELISFFKRLSKDKKELTNFLKKYKELVITDKKTKINMPLVSKTNQIIAKTVMRKDNWKTSNPVYKFESKKIVNEKIKYSDITKIGNEFYKKYNADSYEGGNGVYYEMDKKHIKDALSLLLNKYKISADLAQPGDHGFDGYGIMIFYKNNYINEATSSQYKDGLIDLKNSIQKGKNGLTNSDAIKLYYQNALKFGMTNKFIDNPTRLAVNRHNKKNFGISGSTTKDAAIQGIDIILGRITEASFIPDVVKKPKVWYQLDTKDILKVSDEVIDLIQTAYKNTPLGSFVNSKGDLNRSQFWNAIDIDDEYDADAVIFGRKTPNGIKIQGFGHDGEKKTKAEIIKRLLKIINKSGYWIEASDALEHVLYKANAPYVKSEKVAQSIFPKSELKMIGDKGKYTRKLQDGKSVTETVFGKPKVSVKESIEDIYDDINEMLDSMLVEKLDTSLEKKYGVALDIYEYPDYIELTRIVVPKDKRGEGIGSKVMKDIITYAKNNKKDIFLSPSTDFGGSKGRLLKFYKSFGFKPNHGSNRDFRSRESMKLTNEILNEELIMEGGAYGHMNHPFDTEINLTFGQLKDIVNKALDGNLEFTREKTDGQALAISWRDGKLIAARNKGHLKNRGENALDIKGISTKFQGRGGLTDAYNYAMQDLSKAISSLSDKQKEKIFKNGAVFMNLEVIYPTSVNVIPYGQALLVFHGSMEFNEDGVAIGEDTSSGRILAGMIKQINKDVQDNYTIQGPPVISLPKNQDLSNKKSIYNSKISKLQKEFGLKDSDGVADYHQAWWENWIKKNSPTKLDDNVLKGLVKRWAFFDKSFRLDSKNIEDDKTLDWAKKHENDNHKKISKDNLMKFEDIFLGVGAEVLQFTTSVLTVNPDKALRDMKKRLDQTIKDVKKSGDEKNIEKLKLELRRLNAIGGVDKLVPSEGIVFVYNGHTMKLSGTFASLNQLLGIFYA